MFVSCFLSLICFVNFISTQSIFLLETDIVWFDIGFLTLNWSFLVDPLSSMMFFVVTFISLLVHLYSVSYMGFDVSLNRFLGFLSLFTFFMLVLVSSSNFLQLFLGWEGVGLSSYLLINFWFTRIQANKSALKAMLMNRVGDISLLFGISIIYYVFKSLDFSVLFNLVPLYSNVFITFFGYEVHLLSLIAVFLFIAAVGKSAQLGLHMWLPDAMEGPTPVSALIHAATMVTAGVFLIVRASIFFEFSIYISDVLLLIGALTALFASTTACFQNDLKKIIAYSTCSQLGYMVVACGLSRYDLSMFHLFNHAFFKAALFLSAGVIIHALSDEQDIRRMGGLIRLMPFTYIVMLIASLSLAGFPFLSGFYSKDLILELAYVNATYTGFFAYLGCLAAAFFTNIYSFRLIYLVFLNVPSGFRAYYNSLHEANFLMGLPLFLLTILGVFSGFFFKDLFVGFGSLFWLNSVYLYKLNDGFLVSEFLNVFAKLIPFLFVIVCLIVSKFLFENSAVEIVSNNLKVFLKRFDFVRTFYCFFNQKWFFDFLMNSFFVNGILFFGYSFFYKKIDKGLLEVFGPTGISYVARFLGESFQNLQTGYIFNYLLYFVVVFIFLLIVQVQLLLGLSLFQLIEFFIIFIIFIFVTRRSSFF
jgi:proton-translocating NADH-quinone oxidoreductase chain L